MRLIDADKLITAFCYHCEAMIQVAPNERVCIDGGDCFDKKLIEHAPTIEAEPVKHGRWEVWSRPGDEETGNCSVCKTTYSTEELFMGGKEFPKYCPECGARMDGEA